VREKTTAILTCDCKHEFQDKTYGKGKRLHNRLNNTKDTRKWRCTVCGSMR